MKKNIIIVYLSTFLIIGIVGLVMPGTTTSFANDSVTIELNDYWKSKYEISVSHVGNTWTYHVKEVSGGDLTYWKLELGTCLDKISQSTPTGTVWDSYIKWTVDSSFTEGDFSFTLDGDYPVGTVQALATRYSSVVRKYYTGTGDITGPNCSGPPPPPVCSSNPLWDLSAAITKDPDNFDRYIGTVHNDSAACTYDIGMASYEKFDFDMSNLSDQVLFNSATAQIGPGETKKLYVNVPDCAAQIDVFFDSSHLPDGDDYGFVPLVLPYFDSNEFGPYGNRYSVPVNVNRLLAYWHPQDDLGFCYASLGDRVWLDRGSKRHSGRR